MEDDECVNLNEMLEFFLQNQQATELLTIGIYWIGYQLTPESDMDILEDYDLLVEETGQDGSEYLPIYNITATGAPICINEYSTQIAAQSENVYVL